MPTIHDPNQNTPAMQGQPLPREERLLQLKVWKLRNKVSWVAMGKHMTGLKGEPVSGPAVQKALEGDRMPVANHEALLKAYPDLPRELLPRAEDAVKTYNPRLKQEGAA